MSVRIASDRLSAEISTTGAELQTLRDADGRDLLWNGDPAFWTGRAPLLFPIVGALNGDRLRVDGRDYAMGKHGFARRRDFTVVAEAPAEATLRLEDDAATREHYPFAFALEVRFAIRDATLAIAATVHNPGETALPASFGYHPALRWPLPYGGEKSAHRLLFEADEPAPIRAIDDDGLIKSEPIASPVEGRRLALHDELFAHDALVFDAVQSRAVRYGVPGKREIAVRYPDMPLLGVWTKPGAGFLCIEPWHGIADAAGFTGEFRDKPWMTAIAPGDSRTFAIEISVLDASDAAE